MCSLCLLWLLLAFLPFGEEVSRVLRAVVHANFIMQMGRGRAAGGSDQCDDIALLHFLSNFHGETREMSETRGQAVAMIDDQQVAVSGHALGIDDLPVSGSVNLGVIERRNVQTKVHFRIAIEWV